MSKNGVAPLFGALRDVRLGELFQVDFAVGLLGAGGALTLALTKPTQLLSGVAVFAGIVGVIIGAVIAGVAVQVAFLDQSFLRKLAMIDREPVRYLVPFLFTATIGVFAMLGLITLGAMAPSNPRWLLASVGCVTGLFSCWTVASLLPCLATLVQFVGLKFDAVAVEENRELRGGGGTRHLTDTFGPPSNNTK